MRLYEIDAAIDCVMQMIEQYAAENDGLIDDAMDAKLDELMIERDAKIHNIALYIKNEKSAIDALKAEEKNLARRREIVENRVARLIKYLTNHCNGQKFEWPNATITWRKSEQCIIDEESDLDKKYITQVVENRIDKNAIKADLKLGKLVSGAHIEQKNNIQIK